MSVAELEFPVAIAITVAVAPFEGLTLHAATDPLRTHGSFVRYAVDDDERYGYLQTRIATDLRGGRWGSGLLYDVDASASSETPASDRPLDDRFRQRAELEFRYA